MVFDSAEMNNRDGDPIYPSKPYRHGYVSSSFSHQSKLPSVSFHAEEDEEEQGNGVQQVVVDEGDERRHRKKRKFKNLGLGFEVTPQMNNPVVPDAPVPLVAPVADWSEKSTFELLDIWGDRFVQLGRNSLRSEDWVEVAKKVSQVLKMVRTDTQCRNRLNALKKRYINEKMKLEESGNNYSKWVYFEKMEMLLESSGRKFGLSCGVDSGEYVFMNPNVYLNRANDLDEMRDSPENSDEGAVQEDGDDEESSFRLLADSIQNFGKLYEKIENNKRKHMLELEKMRMEFQSDLELQKRLILDRTQAEIEKIQQGDDDEDDDDELDVKIENLSE